MSSATGHASTSNYSEHRLSFALVKIFDDDIAELIPDNGIKIDLDMVDEVHSFLDRHLLKTFSLLINKIHDYDYTFDAQCKIAKYGRITAVALVTHDESSWGRAKILMAMTHAANRSPPAMAIFDEHDDALHWLRGEPC